MPPCHTVPFLRPGLVVQAETLARQTEFVGQADKCDYCGSARVEWRKCKLICADCHHINKSCADL